jgi:dCTP deaminase
LHCKAASILQLFSTLLGRILTKGRLFSVGILPVNTYADPGFTGRLGITLYNASQRYLKISPGEPIAKIEFSVLPKPVSREYRGQHGYETEIWPISTQFFADTEAPEVKKRIGDPYTELLMSHGTLEADLYRRVQYYSKRVWIQLTIVLLCFALLLAVHNRVDLVTSLGIGIIANIATMLGWDTVAAFRRKR